MSLLSQKRSVEAVGLGLFVFPRQAMTPGSADACRLINIVIIVLKGARSNGSDLSVAPMNIRPARDFGGGVGKSSELQATRRCRPAIAIMAGVAER